MSVNKLISIRNPIVDAMEELNVDHDKMLPKFTLWATRAEQQIASYYQYERAKMVLDIKDCTACLPNNCVLVEVAIMGDHLNNCDNLLTAWCGGGNNITNVNSNGLFLVIDVSSNDNGSVNFGQVPYHYQNNKLLFDRSLCGKHITIQYLRFKEDCDGFLEISENHVLAIKEYLVYMYYKNKPEYIYQKMANTAYGEWNRLCAHARALDAELTQPERQRMVYNYHNPWSGHGMWQGMYTTLDVANGFNIW